MCTKGVFGLEHHRPGNNSSSMTVLHAVDNQLLVEIDKKWSTSREAPCLALSKCELVRLHLWVEIFFQSCAGYNNVCGEYNRTRHASLLLR